MPIKLPGMSGDNHQSEDTKKKMTCDGKVDLCDKLRLL